MEKLLIYWIWFAQLKGISNWTKQQLLQKFSGPEELYRATEAALGEFSPEVGKALGNKDLTEALAAYDRCLVGGIRILCYTDEDYPRRLRNIEDPPMVLYVKGTLPDWDAQPVIGVVGTRKASFYGINTAGLLAAQIAACGGLVVSGAAAGIDAASMEGALAAGKPTVGILGGGVDVVYPAANRELYRKTEKNGCLISEYLPGSRPYPFHFLERNRLISGISDGLLVVEAPEKSGALNTARHAFSQGRDLFVAPGNLGVDTCVGSNQLLQEGAYPVLRGWDVVKHYQTLYPNAVADRPAPLEAQPQSKLPQVAEPVSPPKKQAPAGNTPGKNAIDNWEKSTYSVINKRPVDLPGQEKTVLDLLSETPQLIDHVMDRADLPFGTVQSILIRLALKGLVENHPDGRVSRK